jgi:hypothetical protein
VMHIETQGLKNKVSKTQGPEVYLTLISFQEYVIQRLPSQYPTDGSFGKQTVVEVMCSNSKGLKI